VTTPTLSHQINDALGAIAQEPEPSREQLLEALATHRELLERTRAFAERMEQARAAHPGKVPMFAAAGAAEQLYQELAAADVLPAVAAHRCVVITLNRFPRSHA